MSLRPLDCVADDIDAPFWEACRRHEFVLARCRASGRWHWPAVSDPVDGLELDWLPASGLGAVHTFTVIHQIFRREFADRVPYNVIVVELEEGPLFHSNLVECAKEDIRVGLPVEVVFDDVDAEVTLPRFRPRRPPE